MIKLWQKIWKTSQLITIVGLIFISNLLKKIANKQKKNKVLSIIQVLNMRILYGGIEYDRYIIMYMHLPYAFIPLHKGNRITIGAIITE